MQKPECSRVKQPESQHFYWIYYKTGRHKHLFRTVRVFFGTNGIRLDLLQNK